MTTTIEPDKCLIGALIWSALCAPLLADSCGLQRESVGACKSGRYVVTVRTDGFVYNAVPGDWKFTWQDTVEKRTISGAVEELRGHVHPTVFVSSSGHRFAIFNGDGGHQYENRLLIYGADGKLVKSFGLNDLLNARELDRVSETTSHIQWLNSWGKLTDDGRAIDFETMAGRPFRISLDHASVVDGRRLHLVTLTLLGILPPLVLVGWRRRWQISLKFLIGSVLVFAVLLAFVREDLALLGFDGTLRWFLLSLLGPGLVVGALSTLITLLSHRLARTRTSTPTFANHKAMPAEVPHD